MLRFFLYLVGFLVLAFGLHLLLPGTVKLETDTQVIEGQGVAVGLGLLVLFCIVHGFLVSWQRLLSWPSRRHARKERQRLEKGLDALTQVLENLTAGEPSKADPALKKVGTLLDRPKLHLLLSAQAAALKGDSVAAEKHLLQLRQNSEESSKS
ncbi:MAG: heme biosynthesis HemY N-terminal domain-containing protein [Holosporales bacterium]|jgi:uncharacterized protein HemY